MISFTHSPRLQDLNNYNLNKSPVGNGGAGNRSPGRTTVSAPLYRVHGGDLSPKPSSPSSPSTPRVQSTMSVSLSSPWFLAGNTISPSAGSSGKYFDPELLINKSPSELPQGVDPSQREDYLSDVDFENLLGASRAAFERLPKWRQNDLKKKAGLF